MWWHNGMGRDDWSFHEPEPTDAEFPRGELDLADDRVRQDLPRTPR